MRHAQFMLYWVWLLLWPLLAIESRRKKMERNGSVLRISGWVTLWPSFQWSGIVTLTESRMQQRGSYKPWGKWSWMRPLAVGAKNRCDSRRDQRQSPNTDTLTALQKRLSDWQKCGSRCVCFETPPIQEVRSNSWAGLRLMTHTLRICLFRLYFSVLILAGSASGIWYIYTCLGGDAMFRYLWSCCTCVDFRF